MTEARASSSNESIKIVNENDRNALKILHWKLFGVDIEGIIAFLCYLCSTIGASLISKFTLNNFGNRVAFYQTVQAIFAIIVLLIGYTLHRAKIRWPNWQIFKLWLPVGFTLYLLRYTATLGFGSVSIPTYTVFRSLGIIALAIFDYLFLKLKPTIILGLSYVIILGATIFNALSNDEATLSGILIVVFACVVNATYVMIVKYRLVTVKFTNSEVLFLNSIFVLPLMIVTGLIVEDWPNILRKLFTNSVIVPDLSDYRAGMFLLALLGNSVITLCTSFTSVWILRSTAAGTYGLAIILSQTISSIYSILFLKSSYDRNFIGLLSLSLALFGGLVHALEKGRINKKKAKEEHKEESN